MGSSLPILAAALPTSESLPSPLAGLAPSPALAITIPPPVSGWGLNTFGQVGDNTTTNRSTPVAVSGFTGASAIDAGLNHSLAVTSNGPVAWGRNADGQLGRGSFANSSVPVPIVNITDVIGVSAGVHHSLAVTSTGAAWGWGDNAYEQVGDGTSIDRSSPVEVIDSGVTQVSAGVDHSLALVDGAVWAWGSNLIGQMGDGTAGPDPYAPTPVPVPSGFKAVAAGNQYSLALRASDGAVLSWGDNGNGRLGRNCLIGSCIPSYEPTAISGLTGVIAIAAGTSHSLALLADGTVVAWGSNGSGQLGDGTTTQRNIPTAVKGPSGSGFLGGVVGISAGGNHSVVVRNDGRVFAWGSNASGQLGDGTTTQRLLPTAFNAPNAVNLAAAGGSHTIAVNGAPLGGPLSEAEQKGGGSAAFVNSGCGTHNTSMPVNTATGNFWHTFGDLAIAGRGPGINFTRTYNSADASTDGLYGHGWSSTYGMRITTTAEGRIVTEENGAQVIFLGDGPFTSSAPRNVATLTSDVSGYTYTRRNREIFGFDTTGRLISVTDRNGYSTEVDYVSPTLIRVTDSADRDVELTLTGGRVTLLTEMQGPERTVAFGYNGSGDLTSVIDVNGGTTTFGYSGHLLTTWREPKFHGDTTTVPTPVLTNEYLNGKVVSQTDPMGRETTFDYAPPGAPPGSTLVTDPKENATLDTYAFGLLVSQTRGYDTPEAATWTREYDPVSLGCTKVTDPNGNSTYAAYDVAGNRTWTKDARNRESSAIYNDFHNPETITDAEGTITTFEYDDHPDNGTPEFNLASISTPLKDEFGATIATRVTTYTYLGGDSSTRPGEPTKVTDPDTKEWLFDYDVDTGDLDSATDPLGKVATFEYDGAGRLTASTSPRGNELGATAEDFTTHYSLEPDGLVTSITDPLDEPSFRSYDPNRNLETSIDAEENETTYIHNAANELVEVERADTTTLEYEYHPDGSLHLQIDGDEQETEYEYDAQGRLTAVTDPLNRTTTYGYDPAGNVVTKADPGDEVDPPGTCPVWPFTYPPTMDDDDGCTVYEYNDANELVSIFYSDPETPDVTVTYDNLGRRETMADATGTSTWEYDSLGRLTSSSNTGTGLPAGSQTTAYGHDLRGNMTEIVYPGLTEPLVRTFDDAGRLDTVTDWSEVEIADFDYDADGNLDLSTLGNEVVDDPEYDHAGRLEAMGSTSGSDIIAAFDYTRDDNGGVESVTSVGARHLGLDDHSYDYSALNQLESLDSDADAFDHDPADNLTKRHRGRTMAHDEANQLESVTSDMTTAVWGVTDDESVPADYDGDGSDDVAIFRPSTGTWYLTFSSGASATQVTWGATGDRPVPADYDGDGKADLAVFRPSNGAWYIKFSSGASPTSVVWGGTGDQAVPGDYDGDGIADVAIFHPADGTWYEIGSSSGQGAAVWGANGDIATPGDYDGDGTDDIAVFRPTTGAWYLTFSSGASPTSFYWGTDGDIPVAADYDGDTKAEAAIYRPSNNAWYMRSSAGPQSSVIWGATDDVPEPADYDGDTKADIAVYRPSTGQWYRKSSAEATFDHDSRGNRITTTRTDTDTDWDYEYDQANRMTTAPGSTYTYRGDGLRMAKNAGIPTTFAWDESGSMPMLLAEATTAGTTRYIYGPTGSPIARIDGDGTLYYHHDQLGSIRAITNNDGDTVGTATYDPYGTRTHHSGITTPFGFAGEYTDTETGFQYLRARYYDPASATFLTRDPLVALTQEPYGYVGGNPLNATDPTGMAVFLPMLVSAAGSFALDLGFQAVGNLMSGCGAFDNLNYSRAAISGATGGAGRGFQAARAASRGADDLIDLSSSARRRHILDGEVRPNGTFGGGHRAGTGFPGKTEFPAEWSDDLIMHHVSDVATDPASRVVRQQGRDVFVRGVRDGREIEVLLRNGEIWTAYPIP